MVFRIIEQPKNPPYTNYVGHEVNLKPRLVTCPKCGYEIKTDLPNPRCGDCRSVLITLVGSMYKEDKNE